MHAINHSFFLSISSGRCQCGRGKEWHVEHKLAVDVQLPANHEWQADDEHSEAIEATTYGTIHFHGFGHESTRSAPVS